MSDNTVKRITQMLDQTGFTVCAYLTIIQQLNDSVLQALERCKSQEQKIEHLQGPLEELRREAQTEFDKVRKKLDGVNFHRNCLLIVPVN